MNSQNRATLAALFRSPTPKDLEWGDVERLLKALGGQVTQGRGSRMRVAPETQVWVIHRPHPRPELRAYQILDIRDRLESLGITPDTVE